MKQINLFLLTFTLALILPVTVSADSTELKVFESTFTGATYDMVGETYASGTLTTVEGYDWVWIGESESKSPVLRMTEVGGQSCLYAKLKTSEFAMNTEFSVPGKIQKITVRLGGNIKDIQLLFGENSFTYHWNYVDNDLHTIMFSYDEMTLKSTLPNQTINVLLTPRDASSNDPIYLQSITIETEVLSFGKNAIESLFVGFEDDTNTLVAEDNAYNWKLALPYGNTTIESYPTIWNDQQCLYMQVMGGNSSYPKLTFTSAFPVLGKVKKIVVKAGGDFRVLNYIKGNGEEIWSEDATSNVPYFGEWVLDLGEGEEMRDNLTFNFYTGRNTYLKSVTIVMEDGEETEIEGIMSTFYSWEDWETTDSYKSGSLKSKESTHWYAKFYDPTTEVYSTMIQGGDDESTRQECMVFLSNSGEIDFMLNNLFDVSGTIKKIVVRYTNQLSTIEAAIFENGTGEGVQFCHVTPVLGNNMFSEAELVFDGTTEYTNAFIRLSFHGGSPLFLQSITIVQKEDGGNGGEEPSGKCGENLNYALTQLPYSVWIWNQETYQSDEVPAYKLTITGTGDMYDFSYDSNTYLSNAPWMKDYVERIAEIELPEGLTRVGDEAFDGCYNARVLSLPSTLRSIGVYAFCNVQGWPSQDLRLPENLVSVDSRAFAYCGGIKNLYLPASLTSIGAAAFCGLYYIDNFYVDDANPVYKADGNAIIEKASKTLITGNSHTVIPDYVETIGNSALYGIRVDEMVIPNSVHTICMYAFNYSYIKNVNIPSSVTTIESYAFQGCSKLTSVTIGSGVTSIGTLPFYNCSNVLDVYCYANPDMLTWVSSNVEARAFKPDKMTQMHVRAADLEKWQEKFGFLNVTFVGDLAGNSISPIYEETQVMASALEGQNLSDATIGNIYYNLDASAGNGYMDGYLYITQTTDMSLISDGNPGSSDVCNNFAGIILEVAPGKGVISVDVATKGKKSLAVRIGDGTPTVAARNERGQVYVSYNVSEPTYVYIYAVGSNVSMVRAYGNEESDIFDNVLIIYGITVMPGADETGIQTIGSSQTDNEIYDFSGKRLQGLPSKRGIYIVNGKKVLIIK